MTKTWAEFEEAAPAVAAEGRRLLLNRDVRALLATVRANDPPRIHPVSVDIRDGRLYVFVIVRSAKLADLQEDGRYALHANLDPAAPNEFMVRGRATRVEDPVRATVASDWPFTVDDSYALFELSIDSALLGLRPTARDWPPRYARWSS